jgi:hypothetical protein
MLAATDRRLILYMHNYSATFSSIPFRILEGKHRIEKRIFKTYLVLSTNPRITFEGEGRFMRQLNTWIGICIEQGLSPLYKTQVDVDRAEDVAVLHCKKCSARVAHDSWICDKCARVIDWEKSAEARREYVEEHRRTGYL